ncbi:acyl-CoA desaturase [Pyxidicoccus fallax]|uniref:Acyl-CoA desaturase n=1 Tax=Pyxidicoccus fallax TaxID=394095 RepID=A0A848LB14_9BACT|nr:acyl-CoA desaturase [Pyxidicoccus fallax]NMO15676.1 acyl-CoA desaturase [Pyxidicoccus fallax]NPC77083.1 acyl-CoA desaturase [Pyxidicoccus fallax]
MYLATCGAVFLAAYLLNILTITVGYHRGLAHKAVRLHPALRGLVIAGGNWLTGLDPKAWVVMHRLHHEHSDTPLDPHSPVNVGILGIGMEQLRSYKRVIVGLLKNEPEYTRYAKDLDFPLNTLNRTGRWYLPYVLHGVVGLALGLGIGWLLGAAYFLGMMSHPVQGGLVNSLGHAVGGRNFDTSDNSRNNHLAAWLIFGEGFQNNHHRYPGSASFSYHRHEIDLGYGACVLLEKLGLATIQRDYLIPRPPGVSATEAQARS